MTVHTFESTATAYDACMCDEDLKKGDTLVVKEDGCTCIGVVDTWPFAVSAYKGELHSMSECEAGQKDSEAWWHKNMSPEQVAELLRTCAAAPDFEPSRGFKALQPFLLSTYGLDLDNPPEPRSAAPLSFDVPPGVGTREWCEAAQLVVDQLARMSPEQLRFSARLLECVKAAFDAEAS